MQTATALIVIPYWMHSSWVIPEIFLRGILCARVNFSNNKWLHNFVTTVIFWEVKTVIYTNVLSLMSKGKSYIISSDCTPGEKHYAESYTTTGQ